MIDKKSEVKKTILKLQREFGNVFEISDILGANPEVNDEDVMKALNELEEDGLVTIIDEDSIQVNV